MIKLIVIIFIIFLLLIVVVRIIIIIIIEWLPLFLSLLLIEKLMNLDQIEYNKIDYDEACNEMEFDNMNYENFFRNSGLWFHV